MESLLHNNQLIFWGAIAAICIIPSIAHYWWKIRKLELEAALKQQMIQQGMSADEIQKVLNVKRVCE